MPTPNEPNEHSKPNEPDSDARDGIPSTPQPHDTLPEHMSASPNDRPVDSSPHRTRVDRAAGAVHLLFGAVEDLLADLTAHGAPDGGVVRVERLVRNRADAMGGVATLGIAVTARRADEILSCWVIVARLGLDPWGHPVSGETAQRAARRHHDAQRLIGALVADAGFDVRLGLYQLPEDCYTLAATCEALHNPPDLHDRSHGEERVLADQGGGTGDQVEQEELQSADEEDTEERDGGHYA